MVIFLLLQEMYRPFKRRLFNRLERLSLFATTATLLLLAFLLIDGLANAWVIVVVVVVFVLNVIIMLYFLLCLTLTGLLWMRQLSMSKQLLSIPICGACWACLAGVLATAGIHL